MLPVVKYNVTFARLVCAGARISGREGICCCLAHVTGNHLTDNACGLLKGLSTSGLSARHAEDGLQSWGSGPSGDVCADGHGMSWPVTVVLGA